LDRLARETGETSSAAAIRLIDEGLRMAAHPGIFFQTSGSGDRIARLISGPKILNVIEVLTELEATGAERLQEAAEWFNIPLPHVQIVVEYWADFRDELDEALRRRQQVAAELKARYDAGQELLA
jgi:hypothetical protein